MLLTKVCHTSVLSCRRELTHLPSTVGRQQSGGRHGAVCSWAGLPQPRTGYRGQCAWLHSHGWIRDHPAERVPLAEDSDARTHGFDGHASAGVIGVWYRKMVDKSNQPWHWATRLPDKMQASYIFTTRTSSDYVERSRVPSRPSGGCSGLLESHVRHIEWASGSLRVRD